ncbi:zinc transporter 6 isoform X2 [Latimeria chalumnae]|uniref:zinc transporter 6 isoform X2 n=1 Tax=Latimeria chalumnae TaxID=7897 RepID=UPI0003C1666A|nr:PREDICTED: zinc transporter 6 isoform X2 [Latimeria chalumnae]|eukprot:XP_005993391.1 PREDICTED: zinc transporter 6 isoform X2 [Latimeria chalumnae]
MASEGRSTSPALPYSSGDHFYPRKLGPKPDVVPSGVTERKILPLDKPDMVAVDVINVKETDSPFHRRKLEINSYVLGTIHPFRKSQKSLVGKFIQEFRLVASDKRSWKILLFALTAYTYLTIFDLFSLTTCLISSWVVMKKSSSVFSFGFERLEVLAVFASTVLAQLGALFILKESVERFLEQPEIHTGRLLVGTFVALSFNLLTMLSVKNKPFAYVSEAASTSWLQEHVADISRSLCGIIPGLSSVLLPRMNPFVLIDLAGAFALCITYMLIEINNYFSVDTASAIAIAVMTFGTLYPMSVYSGKVLLQTTPSPVIGQLDKLLREVSTLDGVLEVRNEHFWTVGFGSLAGSVHVRIRRDANEQMVLAHVTNRLSTLVSTLTVQLFKDDWIRPTLPTGPIPTNVLSLSDYNSIPTVPTVKSADELNPITSTPVKPSSSPPEFSFNTPGKNINPVVLPSTQTGRPYGLGLNYGPAPYNSAFTQGLGRPGLGPVHGFRTGFSNVPGRYGTNTQGQFGQFRP